MSEPSVTEPSIPPPPGGEPASWNGTAWVAGSLVWNGIAWVGPEGASGPDTGRFARMRTIDKVILGCLILTLALCVAAAYVALSDWFLGPTDNGGISTLRVCLSAIAGLVVVTFVLFVIRFLTRSNRQVTGS